MSGLITEYTRRFNEILEPAAAELKTHLDEVFEDDPRVCFRCTRAKKIDRFMDKANRDIEGEKKYDDPINQIQDQIGGLLVTRFITEVEELKSVVEDNFTRIEKQMHEPESDFEFGYMGAHYILFLPTEVTSRFPDYDGPDFFELQIKTLFQYAWSETNHAVAYKRFDELNREQRRKTAYIAAQAWGADRGVSELNEDLKRGQNA